LVEWIALRKQAGHATAGLRMHGEFFSSEKTTHTTLKEVAPEAADLFRLSGDYRDDGFLKQNYWTVDRDPNAPLEPCPRRRARGR
jgi:hypothetical protein